VKRLCSSCSKPGHYAPKCPDPAAWQRIAAAELGREHIPLTAEARKLVLKAAAILGVEPRDYAAGALVAQSRAVVELHGHGHFKAAKTYGAKRGN
jgi:hypothetical protein